MKLEADYNLLDARWWHIPSPLLARLSVSAQAVKSQGHEAEMNPATAKAHISCSVLHSSPYNRTSFRSISNTKSIALNLLPYKTKTNYYCLQPCSRLSHVLSSSLDGASVIVEDDLQAFLGILPPDLHDILLNNPKRAQLLEVVLDLGRLPEARYLGECGGQYLRNTEVSMEELEYAQNAVGEFGGDNRAGIEGTLHRISAIRSRKGMIVGLTCRIGRAVSGHVDMVYDLLHYGKSILFVGRPGVGKTTVMRDIARVLADEFGKRVVIVDTSNEIGGDGNIPHAAVGGARRMQVPEPSLQHKVMIEAVENHMPEVIIVDEISTEAEALACRSIAERGIMLIGTAHGERLENIIKNPTLSNLIGGVETVTLGDEEARARRSQKSILERKGSPTFYFLIEMRERHHWVTHLTEKSVDMLLRGQNPSVEVRKRNKQFKVVIERWKTYDGNAI